jgi:hypothetical protein
MRLRSCDVPPDRVDLAGRPAGPAGVRPVRGRAAERELDRDALHAIRVGGRKTYLFAFLNDHARAVMTARFGFAEDTIRLAAALRPALASERGRRFSRSAKSDASSRDIRKAN